MAATAAASHGISTLLLHKKSTSIVMARLNSAVTDGGNVIWGRQLRPALLLNPLKLTMVNGNYIKKEVLVKPLSAAASDSAGDGKVEAVGFAAKYPALVTGFFFFMWYFFNVIFNILNKKIFNYFPYPYFVSVIHLAVGVIYCLGCWAVKLPKRAIEGPQLLQHGFNDAIAKVGMTKFVTDLIWVGLFYHLYNQLATNTLERVAPLTHAVGNVLKRIFVIGFSIVIFGNKISTQTGIGTAIAISGVALYSYIKAQIEEEKRKAKTA